MRRDPFLRLLASASSPDQGCTNIQYIRAADASQRWPRGLKLHRSALPGNDITIYGDGSRTRSFCYVDDHIDGLVRLTASPESVTGPINIGNPEELSIRELASLVIDVTGSCSRTIHRAVLADDPKQRRPDISKAADLPSWFPRTPLHVGLKPTIAYFEQGATGPASTLDWRPEHLHS